MPAAILLLVQEVVFVVQISEIIFRTAMTAERYTIFNFLHIIQTYCYTAIP